MPKLRYLEDQKKKKLLDEKKDEFAMKFRDFYRQTNKNIVVFNTQFNELSTKHR